MAPGGPDGMAGHHDHGAGRPEVAELRAMAARYIASCADNPEGWTHLLAAVAACPGNSFTSVLLFAAQDPVGGPAASREDWQSAGWQVREGEQARVWVIGDREGGEYAAPVFTSAQVRPAQDGRSPPLSGAITTVGGSAEQVLGALTATARRRGYAVTRPDAPDTRPCTDWKQKTITIPARLAPDAAAAALARELAYIIRYAGRPHLADETTASATGAAVIEADSAAWLVL